MKKFIAFVFACGFAVAVVSCGQKSETSENADTTTTVESAPAVSTDATDSTTVAPADSITQ